MSASLIFFSFGFCCFFGDSLNEACDLDACFCFFDGGEGGEAGEPGDGGEAAVDGCQGDNDAGECSGTACGDGGLVLGAL